MPEVSMFDDRVYLKLPSPDIDGSLEYSKVPEKNSSGSPIYHCLPMNNIPSPVLLAILKMAKVNLANSDCSPGKTSQPLS